MKVEKHQLWEQDNGTSYISYLLDNYPDINISRKHPAMVVCGGGGFMGICDREKEPVAMYYARYGYQTFVLNYSTKETGDGSYPTPVYDLAKMMVTIREHADEWNIDQNKIAIIGFSAGGHLCACLGTQWHEDYLKNHLGYDSEWYKPNAVILSYPLTDYIYEFEAMDIDPDIHIPANCMPDMPKRDYMMTAFEAGLGTRNANEDLLASASPINHITNKVPPVFLWQTSDDELIYVGQAMRFGQKLWENHVPFEMHIFEHGPHGMSLANDTASADSALQDESVAKWADYSIEFLNRHFGKLK